MARKYLVPRMIESKAADTMFELNLFNFRSLLLSVTTLILMKS